MAARNRPETAKCRDCVTWHELAEPSTETLARFAQEALREDEGEGYVPPVDDEDVCLANTGRYCRYA